MLVLSRRIKESLVIQDNIIITVLAVEGDKVKLGIVAPRSVSVLREELWQAAQAQMTTDTDLPAQPESLTKKDSKVSTQSEKAGKARD